MVGCLLILTPFLIASDGKKRKEKRHSYVRYSSHRIMANKAIYFTLAEAGRATGITRCTNALVEGLGSKFTSGGKVSNTGLGVIYFHNPEAPYHDLRPA